MNTPITPISLFPMDTATAPFVNSNADTTPIDLDSVISTFTDQPEVLAQHLATTYPELATQLFNELTYWHTAGRI